MYFVYLALCTLTLVLCQPSCPSLPRPVPIPFIDSNLFVRLALKEVDEVLAYAVKELPLPGLIATVVYDQQQIWSKGYGKRDYFDPNSRPPTATDLLRVASITKVFTDVSLFQARDAGLVGLDDYVSKYVPTFHPKDPFGTNRQITLRELASHSAGLQRETPCDINCTQSQVIQNANNRWLVLPQYTRPHYSNFGVALLGRALENPLRETYENWVSAHILNPLNMTKATFLYNQTTQANMAVGVDFGPDGEWIKAPVWQANWDSPAGGLFASADDMANLMKLFFRRNHTAGGSQILDSTTINEMFTVSMLTKDGIGGFGYPFELNYTSGYWTYSKAGELPGFRSNLAMVPDLKLGVFISALVSNTPDDSTFTIPILNTLIPAFKLALSQIQPGLTVPANPTYFTGTYKSAVASYYIMTIQFTNQRKNSLESVLSLTIFNQLSQEEEFACLLSSVPFDNTVLLTSLFEPLPECRWVDDGSDHEYVYFFESPELENSDSDNVEVATSLLFMEESFVRIS